MSGAFVGTIGVLFLVCVMLSIVCHSLEFDCLLLRFIDPRVETSRALVIRIFSVNFFMQILNQQEQKQM
jgi:hypothetical protein